MRTVRPPGPDGSPKEDRDRRSADLPGRVTDCPAFWPGRSADHREKDCVLVQQNSNFETCSVVSSHAHATVHALRGTKFYTIQVH
jgi:hypothetical protein